MSDFPRAVALQVLSPGVVQPGNVNLTGSVMLGNGMSSWSAGTSIAQRHFSGADGFIASIEGTGNAQYCAFRYDGIHFKSDGLISVSSSGGDWYTGVDTFLRRRAAATWNLGDLDAAAPVAQTLSVQGARGGTDTNVAGVATTIQGSLGTGTGASGPIVFKAGTPQTTGTTQHPAVTVLTLKDGGSAGTSKPQMLAEDGIVSAPIYSFASAPGSGMFRHAATGYLVLVGSASGQSDLIVTYQSVYIPNTSVLGFNSTNQASTDPDAVFTRRGAANISLGFFDAASPVAQTLSVQGARGGTDSNTAGVTTTIQGSLGTGTGASGDLVFKVGTPQTTGTTQHAASTALTLHNAGSAGAPLTQVLVGDGVETAPSFGWAADATTGWYKRFNNAMSFTAAGIGRADLSDVGLGFRSDMPIYWTAGTITAAIDTLITRRAAATLNLGAADAAAPIAQTLSVQGARGGTDSNVAGVARTEIGSLGTGSGAGGAYLLQVGKVQGSGTTQHAAMTALQMQGNASGVFASVGAIGSAVSSATTITPTANVFHVTGTTTIQTINLPYTGFVGPLVIIPDGVFLTGLTGNIALATTAVVGKAIIFHYDSATSKFYPSY